MMSAAQRQDPIRVGEARLKIEVDVIPRRTSIPGVGHSVRNGIQQVVIYKEDLPQVMAKVEDKTELLAEAHKIAERQMRQDIKERMRLKEPLPENFDEWPEGAIRLKNTYTRTNYAIEYSRITGRPGPKPLRSCRVLEDLPPLETEEEKRMRQVATNLGMVDSGPSPELAALQAKYDALEKKLEALTGDRKPSGRR